MPTASVLAGPIVYTCDQKHLPDWRLPLAWPGWVVGRYNRDVPPRLMKLVQKITFLEVLPLQISEFKLH